MIFIRLNKDIELTKSLRRDSNRKDWDIKNNPDVLIERYIYEERLHMEDRGLSSLILSTKTCII